MPEQENLLKPDAKAEYDDVITIDLSTLEPHINGPFTPDLSTPISKFADVVRENGWPETFSSALIGSCTNSSYEDMTRAEDLVKQANAAGLKPRADLFVTPGSEQIRATLDRDATLGTFEAAGGIVLANACGPCIGQWKRRDDPPKGEPNAILTSYNRNFPARNDGNRKTMNFLASPELVVAMSYAGATTFNPLTDSLGSFRFAAPAGTRLPAAGFAAGDPALYPAPGAAVADPDVEVSVRADSARLALLEPFAAPARGEELRGLRVLLRARGACTTDTISAAGPWLKFKGHLPNISANTLMGAVNADSGEANVAYDVDGSAHTVPELARRWKDEGRDWIVVAEHNYGEGSAREHAALQPRYLGGRIILAKSFARIHETNLKKQGVLPLTFADEADYERVRGCDAVDTVGLWDALDGRGGEVELVVSRGGAEVARIRTRHTLSADQAAFIRAGSALNLLAAKSRERREEVTRQAELSD
jgi:homoaconitase